MSAAPVLAWRSALRDPLLWLMIALFGLLLGGLSIARFSGYNAGMLDLGSMYQAITSVLRGEPLVLSSANGQVSRLAGHVELIYLLFVPLVALWPDPRTLLISQALLAVSGAFPAYALAERNLSSRLAGRCVALIYLCYPVAQTAVLFDFHGDTLAMPLLLFALNALDRRAWPSYTFFITLALLCKVYVALPVAVLGALLFVSGRERRAGLTTGLAAVGYGTVAFFIVRGLFTSLDGAAPIANNYVRHYFGAFDELAASWDQRLLNALIVIGPALYLAWRGWPWLLPALPIAAAALLSTGPGGSFDYRYHHYATVVPFIVMALVKGGLHVRDSQPKRSWRADIGLTTAIVLLFSCLLVDTPLNPLFWLSGPGSGRDSSAYGSTTRDRMKDQFIAQEVPPQARMAASVFLGAHSAERDTLFVLRYPDDPGGERLPTLLPRIEYALADALFDYRVPLDQGFSNGADYELSEIGLLLRDPAFSLVAARDGLLLFERDAPPERALPQMVAVEPRPSGPELASFGSISLLSAQIEPLGGRRFRADFAWATSSAQPLPAHYVAVSQLDGVRDTRIVHLPTYALLPSATWLPNQLVRERFEVIIPADLPAGRYSWRVAWYDLTSSEGFATDERSLVNGAAPMLIKTIEVP